MGETIHLLLALMRRRKGEGESGASKKGWGYMDVGEAKGTLGRGSANISSK